MTETTENLSFHNHHKTVRFFATQHMRKPDQAAVCTSNFRQVQCPDSQRTRSPQTHPNRSGHDHGLSLEQIQGECRKKSWKTVMRLEINVHLVSQSLGVVVLQQVHLSVRTLLKEEKVNFKTDNLKIVRRLCVKRSLAVNRRDVLMALVQQKTGQFFDRRRLVGRWRAVINSFSLVHNRQ